VEIDAKGYSKGILARERRSTSALDHKGFGSILIEQTFDNARFRFGEKGLACSFEIPS